MPFSIAWNDSEVCVSCAQVFVTQQYLAIAMEYAAGGDMFEHVVRKGGLKESEARWFFQQLLVGVDYVHRMVRDALTANALLCLGLVHAYSCCFMLMHNPQGNA